METLGCPKNDVDSEKLVGSLLSAGLEAAGQPEEADLVVVNTCAFVEQAREESIGAILSLAEAKHETAKLVVTGCLAERSRSELEESMPEIDLVAPFGEPLFDPSWGNAAGASTPVRLRKPPRFDLLELPRPARSAPWAYVKVAEGCDRKCAFCAIPSFRGRQRSRSMESILAEVEVLDVKEVILVAQDLLSWGRDLHRGPGQRAEPARRRNILSLLEQVSQRVERVRLLYLYPSGVDGALVEAVCATGVPYFDLSLQHASKPLLRKMRRYGDAERFLEMIDSIRKTAPDAALRSSFIVGHPGESEEDHDELLEFLAQARLDWAGFFPYSAEDGTASASMGEAPGAALVSERLAECSQLQETITAEKRRDLVGSRMRVLVDSPGTARSHREAPDIDGVVDVPTSLPSGRIEEVVVTSARGPDLVAVPIRAA